MKNRKPIAEGSEWTFDDLEAYETELARVAEGYRLDTYPNQIEIISAAQMMGCLFLDRHARWIPPLVIR